MRSTSWPDAGIAIAGIGLVTTVATVATWQLFGTWRARMSVAREEAYRNLAEETSVTQRKVADEQQKIAEELAALRGRVTAIEKLLREVG